MTTETGVVLTSVLVLLLPLLMACFFRRPTEAAFFDGYLARQRLSLTWLFSTPNWARHDQSAGSLVTAPPVRRPGMELGDYQRCDHCLVEQRTGISVARVSEIYAQMVHERAV